MKIDGAKVVLVWSNGRTVELGTLAIETKKEMGIGVRTRLLRQKIGWELVRKGFWIMLPWRKWEMQEGRCGNE